MATAVVVMATAVVMATVVAVEVNSGLTPEMDLLL
jgi:hypothetical protein